MGWRAQDAWDRENKALLEEIPWHDRFAWKPAILWIFADVLIVFGSYWSNSSAHYDGSADVSSKASQCTKPYFDVTRYGADGRSNEKRQTSIAPVRKPASQ